MTNNNTKNGRGGLSKLSAWGRGGLKSQCFVSSDMYDSAERRPITLHNITPNVNTAKLLTMMARLVCIMR